MLSQGAGSICSHAVACSLSLFEFSLWYLLDGRLRAFLRPPALAGCLDVLQLLVHKAYCLTSPGPELILNEWLPV